LSHTHAQCLKRSLKKSHYFTYDVQIDYEMIIIVRVIWCSINNVKASMSDHSLAWNLLGEATHLLTLSIIAYLKTFLLLIEVLCAHLTLWTRSASLHANWKEGKCPSFSRLSTTKYWIKKRHLQNFVDHFQTKTTFKVRFMRGFFKELKRRHYTSVPMHFS